MADAEYYQCKYFPVWVEELSAHIVEKLKGDSVVMPPNGIVNTTRGLQLWWSFSPMTAKDKRFHDVFLSVMDYYSKKINEILHEKPEFGVFSIDFASSKNAAGLFRMPNTLNSKTGNLTEIVHLDDSYKQDFFKVVKKVRKEKKKSVSTRMKNDSPTPTNATFNDNSIKTLAMNRVHALSRLAKIRDYDFEGLSNNFIFIYHNELLKFMSPDEAKQNTNAMNQRLKKSRKQPDLESTISAMRVNPNTKKYKTYALTNMRIVEMLDISEEEQEFINLRAYKKDNSSANTYTTKRTPTNNKTRNAQIRQRKYIRHKLNKKIVRLACLGVPQKQIAKKVHLSRGTVLAVLKNTHIDRNMTAHEYVHYATKCRRRMRIIIQQNKTSVPYNIAITSNHENTPTQGVPLAYNVLPTDSLFRFTKAQLLIYSYLSRSRFLSKLNSFKHKIASLTTLIHSPT